MPNKTLKITFSGINTLTPASTGPTTDRVYVMMPAARTQIDEVAIHHAFLYIPEKHQVSHPDPKDVVDDAIFGRCAIYHVDHARVTFDPLPSPNGNETVRRPQYHITGDPIEIRPGYPNVAPAEDLGWLATLRDISDGAPFHADCHPSGGNVSDAVAMVVEIPGGVLKASFPCATVQPQVFEVKGNDIGIPKRVYAPEFAVEMAYPATATDVRLVFAPLTNGVAIEGLSGSTELVLQWVNDRVDLRMGNDTESEIEALVDLDRCNPPTVPSFFDNDFVLHYNVFDVPADRQAVPVRGTLHSEHNGCLGLTGGG